MPAGKKGFQKGNKGKPKGAESKTTLKAKEIIMQAIDEQSADFNAVMGTLKEDDPKEWAKIMVKLMDFVLPKKIDLTTDNKALNIPIATWADDSKKPGL